MPKWKHDCDNCRFLGQTIGRHQLVDLYVCEWPQSKRPASLIARFSDDGPDYVSCAPGMPHPEGHSELFAAQALYNRGVRHD